MTSYEIEERCKRFNITPKMICCEYCSFHSDKLSKHYCTLRNFPIYAPELACLDFKYKFRLY